MGQCRCAATQFIDHIDLSEGSGRSYRAAEYTHTQTHRIRLDYFVPLLSPTRLPLCTDLGAYSMLHISPPLLVKKKKTRKRFDSIPSSASQ